jgi:uncharacterized membrane protein YvlD (DUF360 family)
VNLLFIKKFPWKKFSLNFLFWLVVRILTEWMLNTVDHRQWTWKQYLLDCIYAIVMSLVSTFLFKKTKSIEKQSDND